VRRQHMTIHRGRKPAARIVPAFDNVPNDLRGPPVTGWPCWSGRFDWTELEERAQLIRSAKLKNAAGSPPHLRALNGAMVLGAGRAMSYARRRRQIRHYGPARLLCGLTETDWSPTTIRSTATRRFSAQRECSCSTSNAVELAVEKKLADPSILVADTTAQEAAIPHPNEMGLMATFLSAVGGASERAGSALKQFGLRGGRAVERRRRRNFASIGLFAKTKEARDRLVGAMATIAESVQRRLGQALHATTSQRLGGFDKVALDGFASLQTKRWTCCSRRFAIGCGPGRWLSTR